MSVTRPAMAKTSKLVWRDLEAREDEDNWKMEKFVDHLQLIKTKVKKAKSLIFNAFIHFVLLQVLMMWSSWVLNISPRNLMSNVKGWRKHILVDT